MQNTIAGEKMKIGVREKNEKGERRGKITLKKGGKALKMHLFRL